MEKPWDIEAALLRKAVLPTGPLATSPITGDNTDLATNSYTVGCKNQKCSIKKFIKIF